jgi:hypothetical protein
MAVSAVNSVHSSSQVTPVAKSVAATAKSGGSSNSTLAAITVVSTVKYTNPNGSITTVTTYADGHTETKTTPGPKKATAETGQVGATTNTGAATKASAYNGSTKPLGADNGNLLGQVVDLLA